MQEHISESRSSEQTEQPVSLNGTILYSAPSPACQGETSHAGALHEGLKYRSVYAFCRQLKRRLGNGNASEVIVGGAPDAPRVAQSMLLEVKIEYTPSDSRQLKTFGMGTRNSRPLLPRTLLFTSAGVSSECALDCFY